MTVTTVKDSRRLGIPLARTLCLLAVSILINYIDRGNLSIAAPLLKEELHVSASQLGILIAAFFWTYTVLMPVSGWMVDRFNVNWVLAAGFLVWSLATTATGLVHGFYMLMVCRVILGAGESVAFPSYGKILAQQVPQQHRGLANAWMMGDSHFGGGPFVDFPGVLASLAARGYVVASIDYRLSGEAAFPAAAQDVKAAIRWLRSRASDYEIDPTRAMTWGESAGGHLAGLAAVSCNAQHLEPAQPFKIPVPYMPPDVVTSSEISDCVQGGVTWFGAFDIATIAAQAREDGAISRDVADAPEWRMLGCFAKECKQGQIAAASPVTYVDPKNPPLLLIVGAEDKIVPYHQTLEMAEKLKAAGVSHELMVIPGVGHSFIGKTLQQTREANLKALDATFRFIDKTMKNVQ